MCCTVLVTFAGLILKHMLEIYLCSGVSSYGLRVQALKMFIWELFINGSSMHKKASFCMFNDCGDIVMRKKRWCGFLCVGRQFFGTLSCDLSMHPPTAFPTAMHARNLSYEATSISSHFHVFVLFYTEIYIRKWVYYNTSLYLEALILILLEKRQDTLVSSLVTILYYNYSAASSIAIIIDNK